MGVDLFKVWLTFLNRPFHELTKLLFPAKMFRYEIRDIKLPERVQEAMQMQVEAERKKRAAVLESEGIREAEINVAEGKKQSRILASEAERIEQVNQAEGRATALKTEAIGKAEALKAVAEQIKNGESSWSTQSKPGKFL